VGAQRTLLVVAAATALWLWHFARRRDLARANDRLKRFVLSTPILIVLILSGTFNVITASYLGYEVPRDLCKMSNPPSSGSRAGPPSRST